MNADQVIEGIGKAAAAANPASEYCFLWIDWWPMCMTKSEWSGWMQVVGAILAIAVAYFIAGYQLRAERRRDRTLAVSLIQPFAGALSVLQEKLPTNGTRSMWDLRLTRMLLESELKRADSVPLHALNPKEHLGFYAYRLLAMQLVEAFKIAESATEIATDESAGQFVRVKEDAYAFVQLWLQQSLGGIQEAHQMLAGDIHPNLVKKV